MVPNDVRKRLLESITQCSRSNTDLALSDYIFSNSLFHSIAAHRSEIVAYLAPTEAVDERVEYCIDSTKRYTMNVIRSSTSQLNMMNYSARNGDFVQQIGAALQLSDTEAKLKTEMVAKGN